MVEELVMMGITDEKDQQTIFTALGLSKKEEGKEEEKGGGEKEEKGEQKEEKKGDDFELELGEDGEGDDKRAVKFAVGGVEMDLELVESEKEKDKKEKRRGSFISSFRKAALTPQRTEKAPRNRLAGEVSSSLLFLIGFI